MEYTVTLWMPHAFPHGVRFLPGTHARDWKVTPREEQRKPKTDKREYYVLYMEGFVE